MVIYMWCGGIDILTVSMIFGWIFELLPRGVFVILLAITNLMFIHWSVINCLHSYKPMTECSGMYYILTLLPPVRRFVNGDYVKN